MIFTRSNKASRPSSAIAMALVLAATGALGMTAFAEPAHAQKKKKEEERKAEYSKDWVKVYTPLNEALKAEAPDIEAARGLVPAVVAATSSADEKRAAGALILNLGLKADDEAMQLQGMKMMLDSGILEPDLAGQLNWNLFQIYRGQDNIAEARAALEAAIAANYSFEANMSDGSVSTIGAADMQRMIADMYFDAGQTSEGLAYLSGVIDGLRSAGEPVAETLIRTGLQHAYENNMNAESAKYVALLAEQYPTPTTWGDAVIITLTAKDYANPEAVDLLRLSRRMKVYNDTRVLSEYVELLDPRRYPGEVVSAIDEGFALGNIDKTDPFLVESRKDAAGRLNADRAELASLAADARAAGATLKTIVVAGDTFLSYDQPAEAEEFYTKALTMSGVETPVVLTRLGIAQYDQGKYAEAIETFKKVEGTRRELANLWAIYAAQQGGM
ncbi:tetratricopeptide repeat protein [Qipengyuania sp. 1NDH17]|uniref:Tetratricopeptide repeat protein n=1 Tax=Qipengyuania polymorpha TaxID=2867234 RepID=A0ABS7IVB5_9SPHN|nr:tetratricopeptide repeat protein [Qipengyuania polymorpha]MBX7457397.1 tetratricopeptide repeat protein [Qipengyuania polymorpha]